MGGINHRINVFADDFSEGGGDDGSSPSLLERLDSNSVLSFMTRSPFHSQSNNRIGTKTLLPASLVMLPTLSTVFSRG
jgi:hypothetical protein